MVIYGSRWYKGVIMSNSTNAGGGVGFCGMLTIVFIALKLIGAIGWSWWWVLSPLWIPAILVVLVMGLSIWVLK